MRLKQYLRGLGIGIIVTALVIGISSSQKSNYITEEEIKEKASELGMVEETLDVEPTVNPTEPVIEIEDEISVQPSEEFQEEVEMQEEAEMQEETEVQEEVESQKEVEIESQEIAIVAIERGDSSNMVASTLERLQVIDDANLFDEYLCSNEYAKKIRIGTYEIPMESSYEEIMNIICGIE